MFDAVISATGLYIPPNKVDNEQLVASFNAWVDKYNTENKLAIEAGKIEAKQYSSVEFIEKASGIKQRYFLDSTGVLDIQRLIPKLDLREIDEVSYSAQMALEAANQALANAGIKGEDLDMIVCSASNPERAYPGIGIELQELLGATKAYSYDMNIGCSSAVFGLKAIVDAIKVGSAKKALLVSPEICSGHMPFADRDSHFIFGDACTAVVLERKDSCESKEQFQILDTALVTKFSNNIRNDFGYLAKCYHPPLPAQRQLFQQNGHKVFKEVTLMVTKFVKEQLAKNDVAAEKLARIWLHQANINMDLLIAKKIFNTKEISKEFMPDVLQKYGNTSSAGAIIAFHENKADLSAGSLGLICTFGAGYSIGSILVKKL